MMQSPMLVFIWLLPLVGALVLWSFGPRLRSMAGPIGSSVVGVAFIATLAQWNTATLVSGSIAGLHEELVTWLPGFSFGLQLDRLSFVWTLVITGVGFLIHVYSIGYMAGERAFARFFAYLNFFVFAMLTLVLSDNVVGLLIGWGLVGLASYLLIGFYFERPSAVMAARKAFVINVVGDVGILYAVFVIVAKIGSIGYGDVFASVGRFTPQELFIVCACLFIGCAAKSAQVPLHTWLPDAMEGPTPVSALIHAATMVTAGVYLIARFAPLWNASSDARMLVGWIGGITALLGAILGVAQWDIKRILAYSTMSQIGYMIMGVGIGAYDAGVLHFLTHAFFKAQLFLGAGIIIHHLNNEQDVRRMGGLRLQMPFAFVAMLVGVLSICGIPGFSGFFSKDAIIAAALDRGYVALWAIGVITAGITAYYMFRMLFVTFFGAYRGEIDPSDLGIRHPEFAGTQTGIAHASTHNSDAHAPAWLMSGPVAVLIIPSIFIGWLGFGGATSPWARYFEPLFPVGEPHHATSIIPEWGTTVLVLALVALGIGLAYARYGRSTPAMARVAKLRQESIRMPGILVNAFYFDSAIDAIFVRPAIGISRLATRFFEGPIVDASLAEAGHSMQWLGHLLRSLQTGLVRAYALTLALGVACFAVYYAVIGMNR